MNFVKNSKKKKWSQMVKKNKKKIKKIINIQNWSKAVENSQHGKKKTVKKNSQNGKKKTQSKWYKMVKNGQQ